jgi:predicted transcriptional regulator
MNMENMMKHAVLQHEETGATQVSWIQAKFAEEGRYLKLKENGVWTDGWIVKKAYPSLISADVNSGA